MFWLWHEWLTSAGVNPIDGVRWHHDLRRSALAWRELANCRHDPPVSRHEQMRVARLARRDHFLAEAAGHGADSEPL